MKLQNPRQDRLDRSSGLSSDGSMKPMRRIPLLTRYASSPGQAQHRANNLA